MNIKRVIGLIIVILGIGLIFLSFYINQRVTSELGSVKEKTDFLENNPLTDAGGSTAKTVTGTASHQINRAAERKAAPYTVQAAWCLKSGIGLVAVGAIVVIFGRSRRR